MPKKQKRKNKKPNPATKMPIGISQAVPLGSVLSVHAPSQSSSGKEEVIPREETLQPTKKPLATWEFPDIGSVLNRFFGFKGSSPSSLEKPAVLDNSVLTQQTKTQQFTEKSETTYAISDLRSILSRVFGASSSSSSSSGKEEIDVQAVSRQDIIKDSIGLSAPNILKIVDGPAVDIHELTKGFLNFFNLLIENSVEPKIYSDTLNFIETVYLFSLKRGYSSDELMGFSCALLEPTFNLIISFDDLIFTLPEYIETKVTFQLALIETLLRMCALMLEHLTMYPQHANYHENCRIIFAWTDRFLRSLVQQSVHLLYSKYDTKELLELGKTVTNTLNIFRKLFLDMIHLDDTDEVLMLQVLVLSAVFSNDYILLFNEIDILCQASKQTYPAEFNEARQEKIKDFLIIRNDVLLKFDIKFENIFSADLIQELNKWGLKGFATLFNFHKSPLSTSAFQEQFGFSVVFSEYCPTMVGELSRIQQLVVQTRQDLKKSTFFHGWYNAACSANGNQFDSATEKFAKQVKEVFKQLAFHQKNIPGTQRKFLSFTDFNNYSLLLIYAACFVCHVLLCNKKIPNKFFKNLYKNLGDTCSFINKRCYIELSTMADMQSWEATKQEVNKSLKLMDLLYERFHEDLLEEKKLLETKQEHEDEKVTELWEDKKNDKKKDNGKKKNKAKHQLMKSPSSSSIEKNQKDDKKQQEAPEKLSQEEKYRQEEVEKFRREEERRKQQEEAEAKLKRAEEERKQQALEKLKQEQTKREQQEAKRLKLEEKKRRREEAEKLKREEEEKKQQEAEKLKHDEEEKQQEAEKLKRDEEEKRKQEEIEKLKQLEIKMPGHQKIIDALKAFFIAYPACKEFIFSNTLCFTGGAILDIYYVWKLFSTGAERQFYWSRLIADLDCIAPQHLTLELILKSQKLNDAKIIYSSGGSCPPVLKGKIEGFEFDIHVGSFDLSGHISPSQDLQLTDLTTSAIGLRLVGNKENPEFVLYDPTEGVEDLLDRRIRLIGGASDKIMSGPARLFRLIRLIGKFVIYQMYENKLMPYQEYALPACILKEDIVDVLKSLNTSVLTNDQKVLLKLAHIVQLMFKSFLNGNARVHFQIGYQNNIFNAFFNIIKFSYNLDFLSDLFCQSYSQEYSQSLMLMIDQEQDKRSKIILFLSGVLNAFLQSSTKNFSGIVAFIKCAVDIASAMPEVSQGDNFTNVRNNVMFQLYHSLMQNTVLANYAHLLFVQGFHYQPPPALPLQYTSWQMFSGQPAVVGGTTYFPDNYINNI